MIDTIVIIIPVYKVVITDFVRFGGEKLVAQLCNFQIYGNSEKSTKNNPTSSDKKKGYFPRITLKRTPYPMIKGDDESFCCMIIECSLSKIFFENNIEELKYSNFDAVMLKLQEKLAYMGVAVDIEVLKQAYLSRIDFSKNIIINTEPRDIITLISKIGYDSRIGKTNRDYKTEGNSIRFFTKKYHVVIYDKIAEIQTALNYSESRTVVKDNQCQANLIKKVAESGLKILRYEVSLKRKKLKTLDIQIDTIQDAFIPGVAKAILQGFTDKIHDNLRTLRLDNTDTSFIINRIRTAFPKASFNKVMSLESVMRITKEKGYDYLKNRFQLSSSQLSRIKGEIKRINDVQGCEYTNADDIQHEITRILNAIEAFKPIRLKDDFKMC
ncbi:hypothetical protein [Candidatus Deianiraea vastatrix]|nr:hypothetical protein [Candidatus Deianiraea vastatrix]